MKIVDAAKLTDITRIISLTVMLAYMALLFIRFITSYLLVVVASVISFSTIFYCCNARKRVVNRIVHDRKSALFRKNPDSWAVAIREMITKVSGYDGNKRGLLKDTHNINKYKVFLPFCYYKRSHNHGKKPD